MRHRRPGALLLALLPAAAGCAGGGGPAPARTPRAAPPEERPLYTFTPVELGRWLGRLRAEEKDLRRRVMRIARRNLGQPYRLYLLGEFPLETADPDPLFRLEESDCVTFVEHTYAMALARDWRSFFVTLQRIRYMDGEIGNLTRNHYTIPDWEPANEWLVQDASAELAAGRPAWITARTNRRKFFRKFGIERDFVEKRVRVPYVPLAALAAALPGLQPGDMVQVIKGRGEAGWCVHVGLAGRDPAGRATFLHSHRPRVGEVLFTGYAADLAAANEKKSGKAALFLGFRFLRLRPDPLARLRAREGKRAPRAVMHARPADPH